MLAFVHANNSILEGLMMITTLRNQFKRSTYRYVIFFMLFAIIAGMVSSVLIRSERSMESWALRVNGAEISYRDFSHEVAKQAQWLSQIRAQFGEYADLLLQSMGMSIDPKVLALDRLTKEELIKQYAYALGIQLHKNYISESINNALFAKEYLGMLIPPFAFDQAGKLDMQVLKNFLKQSGLSIKEFENKIATALLSIQALDCFNSSYYLPSFELKQQFIAKNLGKSFSVLTFAFDHFLAQEKKNVVTDDEAKAFYNQQNSLTRRYWVPEKRDGIVWKFSSKNYNLVVSEEEINEYYEDNKVKNYVLDPLKVEVRQISEKNIKDSDFSLEFVRQELLAHPDSPWSKKWETLKPFARGERKGEFEKTAFTLQKEGDISSIIDIENEKVFLQLVKRYPRTYKPLSSVKQEIKDLLLVNKFKKQFVKDLKSLVSQNDQLAIESFIKEKNSSKELVSGLGKDESRIAKALFELKKDTYTFYVDENIGVVVKLTNINERYLPSFDSIKEVVTTDLYEDKAKKRMAQTVLEAQNDAKNSSFSDLKAKFNVAYEHVDMLFPYEHKKIQEFEKKGIPVKAVLGLDKIGTLLVHQGEVNSFLIKIDSIEAYNEKRFLDMQAELTRHLNAHRMNFYSESLVASLRRNATIETNETILIIGEEYSE